MLKKLLVLLGVLALVYLAFAIDVSFVCASTGGSCPPGTTLVCMLTSCPPEEACPSPAVATFLIGAGSASAGMCPTSDPVSAPEPEPNTTTAHVVKECSVTFLEVEQPTGDYISLVRFVVRNCGNPTSAKLTINGVGEFTLENLQFRSWDSGQTWEGASDFACQLPEGTKKYSGKLEVVLPEGTKTVTVSNIYLASRVCP